MTHPTLNTAVAMACALAIAPLLGCPGSEPSQPAAGGGGGEAAHAPAAGSGGGGSGAAAQGGGGASGKKCCAGVGSAGQHAAAGVSGAAGAAGAAGQNAPGSDPGGTIERSMVGADTAPNVADPDYATFISHINQFGLDLGQKMASSNSLTDKNIIYSPLSATYALAMTYGGARGTTADEMKTVLGDSFSGNEFHDAADRLARELASRVNSHTDQDGKVHHVALNLADALFLDNSITLNSDFLDLLSKDYDSGAHQVDFIHASEPARTTINDWVANQTMAKITDLFPQGSIDPSTRLVLVNALYFYGSWSNPFKAGSSSDSSFHPLTGDAVQVSTMHAEQLAMYQQADDFAVAELLYVGEKLRMTIVLPADGKFESVRAQVSSAWLSSAVANLAGTQLQISLPKWKMTVGSFSLKQGLTDLGMKQAFTDSADFSGLSDAGQFTISDVLQKAYIGVDEDGTEAAAATGVGVSTSAVIQSTPFVVDHPFLFFIRDENGAVLFSGQVTNPAN